MAQHRTSPWAMIMIRRLAGLQGIGRLLGIILALAAGCASTREACDTGCVGVDLHMRTGYAMPPESASAQFVIPAGVNLADGLTEDEAVLLALWNNASFHEILKDLGIAHGDLIQAGLLPNPEAAYFFKVADKAYKFAVEMPLEAFWLRPIRIAAAERESARVSEQLTQAGLNLIRDVRRAYVDVLLARGRDRVAGEAVVLRGRIASLAEARFKAGDISRQEAATARIDLLLAEQERSRLAYDIALAEERLRNLLALGGERLELRLVDTPLPRRPKLDAAELAQSAAQTRPDAREAAQQAAGSAERLRLARVGWVRFLGVADATSGRRTGHEFGPALRVTLPLFNRNEGTIARLTAEWEKAVRRQRTVQDQIILDVRQAHLNYSQASAELEVLTSKVQPEVEAAIRRAEQAYREGDVAYVVVLETSRQLLASRLRQEQLHADLRRAWAELERSVGRRLNSPENYAALAADSDDEARPDPVSGGRLP